MGNEFSQPVAGQSGGHGAGVCLRKVLRKGFASLCPCLDNFPEIFTRDKDCLFTLFLLFLPFWRVSRGLVVNSSTRAHLSLVSGNANRRLVVNV